jgi:hypothetical protein
MPLDSTSGSATKAAALEYHEASVGLRDAEARRKRAHATAVRLDILPNHMQFPMPVGTAEVVYSDGQIMITVTVAAPITGIDHEGFIAGLLKAGIKASLLRRLQKKYATATAPAHKFISSSVSAG